MKALVAERYGPPETLRIQDVPIPVPTSDDIRVRVCASTVSRTDTATVRGHPFFARAATGLLRPTNTIMGMEFVGEIDMVGTDFSTFSVGERVFGLSPKHFGAHAEFVCIPAHGAVTSTRPPIWDRCGQISGCPPGMERLAAGVSVFPSRRVPRRLWAYCLT